MCYVCQQAVGIWNYVDLDYCCYGMEYKKATRLLTMQFHDFAEIEGPSFLSPLGRRCPRNHRHVTLSGWGARGSEKRPTKGTAVYPPQLAQAWAESVGQHLLRAAQAD